MHNVVIQNGNRTITFLQSAIHFYIEAAQTWTTMTGERHCDIIKQIAEAGLTSDYKKTHIDGFLCRITTNKGKNTIQFINRDNATLIADRGNYPMEGLILTSEDLW